MNLQYAISTWAKNGINSNSNLYIFLRDHGNKDIFSISPTETISPSDLNTWLSGIYAKKIIIIIDACHSGSFIDELSSPSRIIITSTTLDKSSYNLDLDNDGIYEINFGYIFFNSIKNGFSIGKAFEIADNSVKNYFDQLPLLEDEGDNDGGHGGPLPNGGDGYIALNEYVCSASDDHLPTIVKRMSDKTIEKNKSCKLWIHTLDDERILHAYAVIMAPSYSLQSSNGMDDIIDLPTIELYDINNDNNYSQVYSNFTEFGIYKIIFYVFDANGNVNSTSACVEVVASNNDDEPDLVIDDIAWSPLSIKEGDSVTFTVKIKNQGSSMVGSSIVNYYIDGSYYSYDSIGSISAGNTTTETFTWIATQGTHTIKAVADYYGSISENNESNNEKTVTFNVDGKPDLIIESITWSPSNPSVGDSVTFTVKIKNQGTSNAEISTVKYYIDGVYHNYDTIGSISAGGITIETFTWTATQGTHTIKVVADSYSTIREGNENNNEKIVTMPVDGSTLLGQLPGLEIVLLFAAIVIVLSIKTKLHMTRENK